MAGLAPAGAGGILLQMYPEMKRAPSRIESGAVIHDNPDLLPHHLLIEGTVDQVRQLADWDEVSYIFPASADLIQRATGAWLRRSA